MCFQSVSTIYPITRYVDEDRAIVQVVLSMPSSLELGQTEATCPRTISYRLEGSDGSYDEGVQALQQSGSRVSASTFQLEIACPERWWPASLGGQPLYELQVSWPDHASEATCIFGLTSVRPTLGQQSDSAQLLVNGQSYQPEHVIAIDPDAENRFLPIGGSTLLLVRAHYATETLFDAADRAGVLMVQSVPIHPEGRPEDELAAAVQRIAHHPSVAGWYVGHLGSLSDCVEQRLRALDPSRPVYRDLPVTEAA
jgi:beta-galactosidase/beta-glucuronidase